MDERELRELIRDVKRGRLSRRAFVASMNQFTSWEVAAGESKWQGLNVMRWRNEECDRAHQASETELDPVKRATIFIMKDLVVQNVGRDALAAGLLAQRVRTHGGSPWTSAN